MIKNLFLLLLFSFLASVAIAQQAETISVVKSTDNKSSFACQDQFAGNVSQGAVVAQSIATDLPGPIFLCYQDRFTILNSNADLTGDPDLSTQPGVGYAFFQCPPTVTGPDLADIEADPCVLTPLPTTGAYDLWVYTDQPNGTALFQNGNQLGGQTIPEFFNGGDPIQIYFAPITFDDFGTNQDEDGGACIDMNADEAFPVVYLNEIEILNCTVDFIGGEFVGSFVIDGGYPEYNGSTYPSVAVVKNNNFNDQAQIIGGPFMHGDVVNFVTDEPGSYTILVEDGLSCGGNKNLELLEEEKTLTITATPQGGPFNPGDFMCIDFTVQDFDSITSMQWTMNFDPNVLAWNSTVVCAVEDLSMFNLPTYGVENGFIPFQWFQNAATGVNLDDGDCIFQICFDVIGNPGDCTDLFFDGTPTLIAVSCCENSDVSLNAIGTEVCIEEPPTVQIFANACGANNASEGSVSFYCVGGTAPYQYASDCFANGIINSSGEVVTINGISSGVCTIDVLDATGVLATVMVTVTDAAPISYDIFTVDPTCYGVPNARIALRNISGGSPEYDVAWSSGIYGVDSVQFLPGGTYFATITDMSGCEVEQAFVVGTDPILVDITILDTTSCIDSEDGIVLADAIGGTPVPGDRYRYQWNNPTLVETDVITSTNTDVPSGMGLVRVTDDNGCSVDISYDMPFTKFVLADINLQNPLCPGDPASVVITGQTSDNSCSNFSFTWGGGVVSIDSPTTTMVDNLPAGNYNLTITDCDGCSLDTMFTINDPSPIMLPFFVDFDCTSPTGSITVFPGGGSGAITLSWLDDATITSSIRNNLLPGEYTVTAMDANMCDTTITISLNAGVSLVPDTFFVTELQCAGDMNGVITVDVPGVGPYDYEWDGPGSDVYPNDETITMLGAGFYYVTISDGSGCEAVDSVELVAPDTIFLNPVISLPSCNLEDDAQIALIVTGGDGSNGYTFQWDGFPLVSGPLLTNVPAGTYNVRIFDSSACSKDSTIIIPDQETIDIEVNILDDIDCNGETDATVEVIFSGGPTDNGNYGVLWSSGENEPFGMISTDTAFLLVSGTNQVIVFDQVCSDTLDFELAEPTPIVLDQIATDVVDASCFGFCDGVVSAESSGGAGSYSYTWELSGNVSALETDLCAGKFYVEIMDANGCVVRDSVLVGQPDTLIVDIDIFNTFDPSCVSDEDGLITVDYTGGNTGPVVYTWTDDVSDDASASGLENGMYIITVTDGNGCSDTTSYELTSAPPVTASVPSPIEPICFGDRTCIEVLEPAGGSGMGYRFSINTSSLFPIDSCVSVFAGEYDISVVDSDGCTFDTTIIIGQPNELLASVGSDIVVGLGDSTSTVEVQLNQTFIIDTIIWTSSEPFECIDDDCTQIFVYPNVDAVYTVTAIDVNGCVATDELVVRIDDERKVFFPNIFSPNGDGINDRFQLYTGEGVELVEIFQIYDRWGNLMFQEEELTPNPAGTVGWDGTFNGTNVGVGVYSYRAEITFVDGKTVRYAGTITVIR